jgi:GMP synthase (glutamine-hydrolysing)
MTQKILIIDFGSQVTQLIARRIREMNVYCEIHPFNHLPKIGEEVTGIILSGSPCSVRQVDAPSVDIAQFRGKIPVLGICYGAQLLSHQFGGTVNASDHREYGRAKLGVLHNNPLFENVSEGSQVWMSHGDTIMSVPADFQLIGSTDTVKVAAFKIDHEDTYGIQFHPEVTHSTEGATILKNFVVNICKTAQSWTPDAFVETTVAALKEKLGNDKVVLGLSGGVDSSVAAVLIDKAIGKNLYCIFVDNGLLRKNEFESVLHSYQDMGLNVKGVNAKEQFYTSLKGLVDPEAKRKAIGKTFIDIFDQESHLIEDVKWLGQGTIYPDVIESVSVSGGPSQTIKSHHNVGGLPDYMKLKVVEPLNTLFKDEVRRVGKTLGIDPNILGRHPFPGPGLGIRILGDITPQKVAILQEVDAIFINGLKYRNLYDEVWQAGAMLLPIQSVGVMGDERTYEQVVALRAVSSVDGMTADWCHLPFDFLADISNEIINKVKGVNRVVYDISSKPPATIEWE